MFDGSRNWWAFLRQPTSVERGCDLPNFLQASKTRGSELPRFCPGRDAVSECWAHVGVEYTLSRLLWYCKDKHMLPHVASLQQIMGRESQGASLVPAWLGWFLPKFSFSLAAFVVGSQSEPDLPSAFLLPPQAPHISMLMLNNAEDCTRHLVPLKVSFLPDFPSPWPVSVPRSHRLKVGLSPSPRCRGHGNSCSHCAGLAPSKNQLSQPRISAVFG